jgi:hypothetical protein
VATDPSVLPGTWDNPAETQPDATSDWPGDDSTLGPVDPMRLTSRIEKKRFRQGAQRKAWTCANRNNPAAHPATWSREMR